MSDSRLKGRVKGLFAGTAQDGELLEQPSVLSDVDAERQALQVLVLARKTADDHISSALQESDRIRADARAKADGMLRDAQAHGEGVRREAGKILSDAQAKAEGTARDAHANAEAVRRDASKILADAQGKGELIGKEAIAAADGVRREAGKALTEAQARAEQMAKDAQAAADGLEHEAQARYDQVVGSLESKRAALQEQIEALQQFDRDYRVQLATFMQSQLQALGLDDMPSRPPLAMPAQPAQYDQPAPYDQPAQYDQPAPFDLPTRTPRDVQAELDSPVTAGTAEFPLVQEHS